MEFVLDNSIVMTWCFRDESTSYTRDVLKRLEEDTALVPPIWPMEVGNVLLAGERRKRITPPETMGFLAILNQLPIRIEEEDSVLLFAGSLPLARELDLSLYDATYLSLAQRKGVPIATLDKKLRKSAKACRIPLY